MTDPVEFISCVHKGGVRYLLIGRQAMIAYGIPVQTMDYDLYIDGDIENTKTSDILKSGRQCIGIRGG